MENANENQTSNKWETNVASWRNKGSIRLLPAFVLAKVGKLTKSHSRKPRMTAHQAPVFHVEPFFKSDTNNTT